MKNLINSNPRFVFLMVGLIVGFGVTFLLRQTDDIIIQEKTAQINELKEKTIRNEATITSLNKYVNKLEQKTKTYKLIKPDGTIIEKTESEIQSETEITEQVKAEYKQEIAEHIAKIESYYSSIVTQNKKLGVNIGMSQDKDIIFNTQYNLWGPLLIGGGINYNNRKSPEYYFTLGIKL